MKRWIAATGVVALLALTGCESDPEKSDAPPVPRENIASGTNTHVILLPDGFRNIVVTCYGKNGVYVTSRGWNQAGTKDFPSLPSGVAVVPNDPMCPTQ